MIKVEKTEYYLLRFSNSVENPEKNIYKFSFVVRPYKSCLIGISKLLKTGITYKDVGKGSWNRTYKFKNNKLTQTWKRNNKTEKCEDYIADELLKELIEIVDDIIRDYIDEEIQKMSYKIKVIGGK